MIDAVLLFGLMNIVFEFVLLSMISPRWRLRVLGNRVLRNAVHVLFLLANLMIHWGTLIGTMSAILAFISSMVTVRMAIYLYGHIESNRHYHVGFIKYNVQELT